MTVCVYAASSSRVADVYVREARELGRLLSESGIDALYGGGRVGLMGAFAEGMLAAKGTIAGVIPQFMIDEGWDNPAVREIVTPNIHERKAYMLNNSQCAIALPGGVGTLEEVAEAITWHQLGLFNHNVILINTNGYYDDLVRLFARMESEGFMRNETGNLFLVAESAAEAMRIIGESETHCALERGRAQL